MADTIYTNQTPASSDFDGQDHGWGMEFTVTDDCICVGGRAWVPSGGRPTTFFWQLWRVGDTTLIAESDLRAVGHGTPSNGAWMSFDSSLFTTPGDVALEAAEDYIVAVFFDGEGGGGVFADPGSFPIGSGGLVSSSTGRFHNGSGQAAMPTSTSATYFFADVDAEADGGTTHEGAGTAAATGAASATSTVDRAAAGTAAATGASSATATVTREGAGTAAATGASSATSTVDREASGTAAATGAGTAAATVDRAGSGAAAAAGASSAAATVTREAAGTAAATAAVSASATVDPGGTPAVPAAITVGRPRGRWHVGAPSGRWHVGRPRGA